jgi:hypothetical protein
MTQTITPQYTPFDLAARLQGLVEAFRKARARRAAFNTAYGELQMLSDRELVEFGLHRSDLIDLARAESARR